jgi:hypothetical protein
MTYHSQMSPQVVISTMHIYLASCYSQIGITVLDIRLPGLLVWLLFIFVFYLSNVYYTVLYLIFCIYI